MNKVKSYLILVIGGSIALSCASMSTKYIPPQDGRAYLGLKENQLAIMKNGQMVLIEKNDPSFLFACDDKILANVQKAVQDYRVGGAFESAGTLVRGGGGGVVGAVLGAAGGIAEAHGKSKKEAALFNMIDSIKHHNRSPSCVNTIPKEGEEIVWLYAGEGQVKVSKENVYSEPPFWDGLSNMVSCMSDLESRARDVNRKARSGRIMQIAGGATALAAIVGGLIIYPSNRTVGIGVGLVSIPALVVVGIGGSRINSAHIEGWDVVNMYNSRFLNEPKCRK
ncbi:MAG: hypothetical protein NZ927_04290 [Candidatus Calescibacterium sp.]|nr:hypothetical protein [Candidatus Calescibacterium sp.]MCX7733290.1 hypothetical protein [bacterium]MDW8086788.1 hypothetical protein [Candidatus Calescibacterium sp.]